MLIPCSDSLAASPTKDSATCHAAPSSHALTSWWDLFSLWCIILLCIFTIATLTPVRCQSDADPKPHLQISPRSSRSKARQRCPAHWQSFFQEFQPEKKTKDTTAIRAPSLIIIDNHMNGWFEMVWAISHITHTCHRRHLPHQMQMRPQRNMPTSAPPASSNGSAECDFLRPK